MNKSYNTGTLQQFVDAIEDQIAELSDLDAASNTIASAAQATKKVTRGTPQQFIAALSNRIDRLSDFDTGVSSNTTVTSAANITASVNYNYFRRFNRIINTYMSDTGEGNTMAAQIVTAVNKLIYKWYNDGDVFDNTYALEGWCNDLSSYANWLYNHCPDAAPILNKIKECWTEDQYEDLLKELANTLLTDTLLEQFAGDEAVGSIYTAEGPYEFVENQDEYDGYDEYDDDEDDDDEYYDSYSTGVYSSEAVLSLSTDCQRYIHSLMPKISNLLEVEGYDVGFEETDTNLVISLFPSGQDVSEGEYSFPKSALNCENFNNIDADAANIVEILMNRASFDDLYACDTITGSYDMDDDDSSPWRYLESKQVGDADGFLTDYTLYVNDETGKYICMFGDNDAYGPDEDYADHVCDSEEEAYEWFNNYNGFYEDDAVTL